MPRAIPLDCPEFSIWGLNPVQRQQRVVGDWAIMGDFVPDRGAQVNLIRSGQPPKGVPVAQKVAQGPHLQIHRVFDQFPFHAPQGQGPRPPENRIGTNKNF